MRIREHGKLIKLLRAERAEDSRRARHIVVGTCRVDEPVPAALLALLTRDERQELSRWLAAYHDSQKRTQARAVLDSAAPRLDQLVEALEAAADTLHPDEADCLWHQLQAIAKTLRRAGHPRPQPERRPAAPPPGQMDLVDELVDASLEPRMADHAATE
ncbi:hypothetical protein [Burkholderia alba]|uniref:hypothetical protein n=1 Tax=Burkholderia alba TaxID=2683677 RepID=UPI002B05BC87|nr:hypothetical protein [Burkholderia alba]